MTNVKWVDEDDLCASPKVPLHWCKPVPVIPLADLADVVEFAKAVMKNRYKQWEVAADFAGDSTNDAVLHADLMEHDTIYADAQRLLALMEETHG